MNVLFQVTKSFKQGVRGNHENGMSQKPGKVCSRCVVRLVIKCCLKMGY